MKEIANKTSGGTPAAHDGSGLDERLFRIMAITVALSVIGTVPFFPWRVTTGVLVGGLLSLLNHHWMRTSISAVFDQTLVGSKPRIKVVRYVLRYLVIGATVYAAYRLDMVSLPATLVGLCSFVVALFAEAFREFYFAIIRREGIN